MTRSVRSKVNRLLLAALAATPMMAGAASGEFTFVVGEVSLTKANGQRVTPARGTPVDPGDRIATGANGMAQLTMVDNARLSLRPGTQFSIEAYPDKADSQDGAILSLVRGTLRTFTGLLASTNRDKYVMKTRVATVGIRGSGNILYACEGTDCDASIATGEAAQAGVTVNHTIEGSHAVSNTPSQQASASTLITGPGQTVLVSGFQAPRYIPTPQFISDAAVSMVSAKPAPPAAATTTAAAESRNFSPSDVPALPASQRSNVSLIGNNGLGFANDLDAAQNAGLDPLGLQDVLVSAGAPFSGQAQGSQMHLPDNQFRGYVAYPGGNNIDVTITGGTLRDPHTVILGTVPISMGRWENAGLGLFGPGSASAPLPGSIHWIYAPSGFPAYISDVLTGSATYSLVAATSPTNQNNTVGTLGSAVVNVNFSSRVVSVGASVTMPANGANAGGAWNLTTGNIPLAFNQFSASTSDLLTITSGTVTSGNNTSLTGSIQGSLVGTGIGGAILGYGINDLTSSNPANWNIVSGVAAFQGDSGTPVDTTANYREGRVSDPNNTLSDFIRSYATTDRPDEVVSDATGRVTTFSAAYAGGSHATYAIGTAQVVQSGIDPETGLVWGRWSGGTATVSRNGQSINIPLASASLHYVFAGTQNGPVQLPLTGQVAYSVLGSTSPTDSAGHVGTLGNATLNVNFDARTVNAAVNLSIANQQWSGSANNMPIYREQYFSAYSGSGVPGLPNPNPLVISCSPSCGQGATGSFDGFFSGRTGQRAGMMYNLNGNQGAVAFTRPGG